MRGMRGQHQAHDEHDAEGTHFLSSVIDLVLTTAGTSLGEKSFIC